MTYNVPRQNSDSHWSEEAVASFVLNAGSHRRRVRLTKETGTGGYPCAATTEAGESTDEKKKKAPLSLKYGNNPPKVEHFHLKMWIR